MNDWTEYQRKIERLEAALTKYVVRYGLSDSAREALVQVEGLKGPYRTARKPNLKIVKTECSEQLLVEEHASFK